MVLSLDTVDTLHRLLAPLGFHSQSHRSLAPCSSSRSLALLSIVSLCHLASRRPAHRRSLSFSTPRIFSLLSVSSLAVVWLVPLRSLPLALVAASVCRLALFRSCSSVCGRAMLLHEAQSECSVFGYFPPSGACYLAGNHTEAIYSEFGISGPRTPRPHHVCSYRTTPSHPPIHPLARSTMSNRCLRNPLAGLRSNAQARRPTCAQTFWPTGQWMGRLITCRYAGSQAQRPTTVRATYRCSAKRVFLCVCVGLPPTPHRR